MNQVTDTTTLINERKKTSENYARWQTALQLRDRIYKECGTGNTSSERAIALIRFWHAKWKEECAALDSKPSEGTLALLAHEEEAMKRAAAEDGSAS